MSHFCSRWKRQLIRSKIISGLSKYPRYFADWFKYSQMESAEPIKLRDTYPCLFDRTAKTSMDSHYFYQGLWAFKKIYQHMPEKHVDVGSDVNFVVLLTAFTELHFIDIRPLEISEISNFKTVAGSILEMPYENDSLNSISSLHVAEHVGLGRYGDPLDPLGTKKAAAELSRCLARGGNLYFSLPVGRPRLCFHAHRIHSPGQILQYFPALKLVEFSGTDEEKTFHTDIDVDVLSDCKYACGMFWFTKE